MTKKRKRKGLNSENRGILFQARSISLHTFVLFLSLVARNLLRVPFTVIWQCRHCVASVKTALIEVYEERSARFLGGL